MNSIKEFRENVGLKQYEAAKKLGITKDYLSMLENRRRTPSTKLITQMALIYNKAPEDIFLAIYRTYCSEKHSK
ncbi:helix-turn-helix transcriptional regulator [Clostridium felsineum]|uniref:helix-turn-helix transcriptional regulator n=1 Tax=Clostridium felsineum TaxID=36839 RepID=UPI00214D4A6A|nr:helix-turn-helix transcriptional regulator [Clostridium felsineum]MCR3758882.1 helix-turn-helix transcriptional regulator [Clostridium felsineum]